MILLDLPSLSARPTPPTSAVAAPEGQAEGETEGFSLDGADDGGETDDPAAMECAPDGAPDQRATANSVPQPATPMLAAAVVAAELAAAAQAGGAQAGDAQAGTADPPVAPQIPPTASPRGVGAETPRAASRLATHPLRAGPEVGVAADVPPIDAEKRTPMPDGAAPGRVVSADAAVQPPAGLREKPGAAASPAAPSPVPPAPAAQDDAARPAATATMQAIPAGHVQETTEISVRRSGRIAAAGTDPRTAAAPAVTRHEGPAMSALPPESSAETASIAPARDRPHPVHQQANPHATSGELPLAAPAHQAQQPQATGPAAGQVQGPAPVAVERAVLDQVSAAIPPGVKSGTIDLVLDPPELGKVKIVIEVGDHSLKATLTADRSGTGDLIRRHLDVLNQDFRAAGFTDVDLSYAGQNRGRPGGFTAGIASGDPAPEEPAVPVQPRATAATAVLAGRIDIRL